MFEFKITMMVILVGMVSSREIAKMTDPNMLIASKHQMTIRSADGGLK